MKTAVNISLTATLNPRRILDLPILYVEFRYFDNDFVLNLKY